MMKRLLFAGAALLLCGAGLVAMDMDGYVKVYWNKFVTKMKRAPSLEDRVAKLKLDIARMQDEMNAGIGEEIRLERDGERIKKELDREEKSLPELEAQEQKLRSTLTALVEAKKSSGSYDEEQMKRNPDMRTLVSLKARLEAKRKNIAKLKEDEKAQIEALAAVRADLQEMREEKEKWEGLVKNMEDRIKQLRESERENKFGMDRSLASKVDGDYAQLDEDVTVVEQKKKKQIQYGLVKPTKAVEQSKSPSVDEILKGDQKDQKVSDVLSK